MSSQLERQTYSADEAFALLGMKRSTGFDALKNGTFPVKVIRVGKRYYIPRAPLDELLSYEPKPTVQQEQQPNE